jgi:hypothetical protein
VKRPRSLAGLALAPASLLGALLLVDRGAAAQESPDSPSPGTAVPLSVHAHAFDRDLGTNPFRGSTLMFEQSLTTQTADVGTTPESYVPLYELWLSLRPRYWFDEHWSVRARLDYTKELTNAQTTTNYRQDVVGDLWTDLVYTGLLDGLWKGTRGYVGARALWPTSQVSEAAGVYVQLGATAGAEHEFDLNGDAARWLNNAHVALRVAYLHAFTNATTSTDYGSFAYTRQNVDGFSFLSDQISGQTVITDSPWFIAEAGMQIAPRLSATVFGVLIDQWHAQPSPTTVATATGPYTVSRAGDQQFTQQTWLVASLDYLVLDELEIGLGYYNLASVIAPDGQQRSLFGSDNVWWSPDARFFLSLTANLDALYDDATRARVRTVGARAAR